MAATSMLSHLNDNTHKSTQSSPLKQGWIKKRSRHLKQWRQRYATIEENKYLCTYQNEEMSNCTEKIDIAQCTIQYTIDKPKEFKLKWKLSGFHFECESITDTNEWLTILKSITLTTLNSPKLTKKQTTILNETNENKHQNELQTNNNNFNKRYSHGSQNNFYGMSYYNQFNQSNNNNWNLWKPAYDPTICRYYWYHTLTKQTSWYRPYASQSMFSQNISNNWNTQHNSALLAQSTTNLACSWNEPSQQSQQPDQSLINELEKLKLENQRLKQNEKEKERLIEENKKHKMALLKTNKSKERFIKEKEMEQKEILEKFGGMFVWEWMDDNSQWQEFEDRISNKIEKIYKGLSFTYTCNVTHQICKIKKLNKNTAKKTILSTNKSMICRQLLKMINKQKNKYEWQWDNNGYWETYSQEISDMVENLFVGQHCSFEGYNNNNYNVSKISSNTAIQINVLTKFKRNVRQIQSTAKTYPKWWKTIGSRSKQDYAKPELIELDLNRYPAKKVMEDFYKTVKNKIIVKIESVENQMLYDKYYNERQTLVNLIGKDALNERQLYHGTKAIIPVQQTGFRKEFNTTHRFGQGTYFHIWASYSCDPRYSYTDAKGITKIFQCNVICGDSIKGQREWKLTDWPTKRDGTGQLYDSLVDNVQNPFIFVIHENYRAYPMFLIHFKDRNYLECVVSTRSV